MATAQVSPNVPVGDPLYDYLERLADQGLTPGYLRGSRPFTVAFAARLLREAAREVARRGEAEPAALVVARDLLERWRPHDVGPVRLGGAATVAAGGRDDRVGPTPESRQEGVGFLEPSAGGPLAEKSGVWLGAAVQATGGRWFAAEAAGRLGFPTGGADARLDRGYVKLGWGSFELEVGRDDVLWGQGRYASMTLSGHAPGLAHVALRTALPVRLPWVFRYLGDFQATIFLARLDQPVPFRSPYVIGERLALRPTSWLELGWVRLFAFGGEGAPHFGAGRFAEELFLGVRRDIWTANLSNNAFSYDLRVRVKRWFEVYAEHYLEDCCARLWNRDSSLLAGVRRARVFSSRDDLALEFVATSFFAYQASGTPEWANDGRVTGHPLGNRGYGGYALWRYLGDHGEVVRLRLSLERRRLPDDDPRPPEWRLGGHLDARVPLRGRRAGRVDGRLRVAVERLFDADHVADRQRTAGLVEVAVEASF